MGLVLARVWRGQALGISSTERLKLTRQMAAAAGKKESVPPSLFVKVKDLKVEEELFTMATLFSAGGLWMNRQRRAAEGVEEADLRSGEMETS